MLLLPEGDRTCDECQGKGIVPEERDNGYECYDIAVPCDYCENGRVTERQNTKHFDMTFLNELRLALIRNRRFRDAIKRRGCEGRGVKFDRFILSFRPDRGEPVCLESGPVIYL